MKRLRLWAADKAFHTWLWWERRGEKPSAWSRVKGWMREQMERCEETANEAAERRAAELGEQGTRRVGKTAGREKARPPRRRRRRR